MTNDIDLNEFTGGGFFKGRDFADGPKFFTISDISVVEFRDGSRKPALTFSDAEKRAVLGPMNIDRLTAGFGDKSSSWIGRTVMLMAGPEYLGNPTLHILPQKPLKPANGTGEDIPF